MSSAKEKLLASAQKFIAKGQMDKAIKDYQQVVALDPNDTRHRQRLAELFVKINRKDDAVTEYKAIGKYYSENGYYLKAIAVYKQIQKLTPDDIDISLTLATLNEKQGLTGNALAEYGIVFAHHQKAGNTNDAIKVLESMLALDPDNLNTQLQFAEIHCAAGMTDKAYQEFTQLALLLWKQGNNEVFSQVCTRIQTLFPERKDFQLDFLSALLENGDTKGVVPQLQQLLRNNPTNLRGWQLLVDACRRLSDNEKLKAVLQQFIKLFPGELNPREELVRLHLAAGDAVASLELLTSFAPTFAAKGSLEQVEALYAQVEQLLPDDKRVLAGLKKVYEAAGEKEKLAAITARIAPAPAAPASPTVSEKKVVADKSAVADKTAAAAKPGKTAEAAPAKEKPAAQVAPPVVAPMEWEEEIDLSLPGSSEEPAAMPSPETILQPQAEAVALVAELPELEDLEPEPELLEPEAEELEPLAEAHEPAAELVEESLEEVLEELEEAELELAAPDLPEESFHGVPVAETPEPAAFLQSADEMAEFPADLELETDVSGESENITHDVLSTDYGEMGELFTDGEITDSDLVLPTFEPAVSFEQETVVSLDMGESAAPGEIGGGPETVTAEDGSVALVLKINPEDDWLAREGIAGGGPAASTSGISTGVLADDGFAAALGGELAEGATAGFWGEDEDIAALGEELFASGADGGATSATSSDKYSLDGLVSAFKKGLHQQVESGDTETHFNLGIAYKEMGLYDDAIGEFEQAAHDPQRKVDCISLQGICYREKGDDSRAEELLRSGVALEGMRKEELQSLKYELALLLESTGRPSEALQYYLEVRAISPGFRDTSSRISALQGESDAAEYDGLEILDLETED